jgi:large subunit ribosomal protein L24
MKIKKGDNVIILAGKDKGKSGKIIRSLPSGGKVVVEGINILKKHQKSKKSGQGGQILDIAMPIDVSNVKKSGKVESKSKKK